MNTRRKSLILLILPILIALSILTLLLLNNGKPTGLTAVNDALQDAAVPEGWKQHCVENEFSAIYEMGDVIWAGGRDGVFQFDRYNKEVIGKLELDIELTYVRGIVSDNQNRMFIATQNGLVIYEGGKVRHITEKNGLPDNRINSILKDRQGDIWIGTWNGAAVYSAGGLEKTYVRDGDKNAGKNADKDTNKDANKEKDNDNDVEGLHNNVVNVLFEDSSGGIWFGSYAVKDGGVSCLKDGSWYSFGLTDGLPNENVTSFYEDGTGGVWCGTGFMNKGGACRFAYVDGKPVIEQVIVKADGLAGEKVRSIFEDSSGNVWFCSEYDGVALFKNQVLSGKSLLLNVKDGLSDPEIKAGITDKDGNLWLAARKGITIVSKDAINKLSN